jgi:hypothetical protein
MSKAAERWDTKQVLFLFLLISPFFLSYYGYDSIGASLPDLGSFSNSSATPTGYPRDLWHGLRATFCVDLSTRREYPLNFISIAFLEHIPKIAV